MIVLYLLTLFALGVYSYSQIDLNLTLLQNPIFLSFQQAMIQLGYFNRPISTAILSVLIVLLFLFYIKILKNPPKSYGLLIVGVILISLLSYPAFSHDFFNYLFDAKILTHYGQNPYLLKALDFPLDTWTRFMHWTHRTYPYGPIWLILTLPFSYLGFGKFILTVLNFKFLFVAIYLANLWLIKKISSTSVLFFALNPLVIVESLVSPHLDAAMVLFFLLGVFFFQTRKKVLAIVAIFLSGGIKFLTLVTLPLFFKFPNKKILQFSLILILAILIPVILQREVYPWYFLPPIAIASLLVSNKKLVILTIAVSFGLMLRYLPLVYIGKEVLFAENILTIVPILLCVLGLTLRR